MRFGYLLLAVSAAIGCNQEVEPARDGGSDLAPADSVPLLPGSQLLAGNLGLAGITRGGLAVVVDFDTRAVLAVPLEGGAPITVAPAAPLQTAAVDGDIVYVTYPDYASRATSDVGPLALWTAAGGLHVIAQRTHYLWGPVPSSDGKSVIFLDNFATDGETCDLVYSRVDGSDRATLATAVTAPTVRAFEYGCAPVAQWIGARLVIGSCPAGDTLFTATVYEDGGPQDFVGVSLGLNSDGTHVLFIDQASELTVVTAATGDSLFIDRDVDFAEFAPDGAILYSTFVGELKRATLGGVNVLSVTLQSSNIGQPLAIFSPDGDWALASGLSSPVLVTSLRGSMAPFAIAADFGAPLGFSDDASYVFFIESAGPRAEGSLRSVALSNGASKSWSTASSWAVAGPAGRLYFNHHAGGDSELRFVDLARPEAGSTLFARPIDRQWFSLTADKRRVVYTSSATDRAGLYLATAP